MDDQAGKPQSAVTWAFQAAKKYKTAVRFVLVALAEYIDTGNACPSHMELAAHTGLARSTIQGALGELEKDGVVAHVKNGGTKVRGGKTNCYRLVGWNDESSLSGSHPSHGIPPESVPGESSPPESTLSSEPVEYIRVSSDAAGEKDLSLKQEKDRQTDSVKPKDTREPDDGLTPEQRSVRQSFEGLFGPVSITWWNELEGLIAYYSHVFVQVVLTNAQKLRDKGEMIDNPMAYIRQGLANLANRGLIPHLTALKPAVPAPYSPNADLSNYTRQAAPVKVHPKQRAPEPQPVIKASGNFIAQDRDSRREAERAKPYGTRNPV